MSSFVIYSALFVISAMFLPGQKYSRNGIKRNKKDIYLPFAMLVMCFMASFRAYTVGNDTMAYYYYFGHMGNGDMWYNTRIELGYKYLNILVSKLTNNYTVFLCITSLIIFAAIYYFARRYVEDSKLFVLFFWFFAFVSFVSPLRQTIALSIIIIALRFAENRKYIVCEILCVLAFFFHTSAIGMLMIPLMDLIKPKNSRIFIGIFAAIFAVVTNFASFLNYLFVSDEYYEKYLDISSGVLAVVFNAGFAIVPLILELFVDNQSEKPRFYNVFKWGTVFYAVFYILSISTSAAGRIAYYFLPFVLAFWCYVIRRSKLDFAMRGILISTVFCFLIAYRVFALLFRPEWNSFFPFYYVWN